MPALAGTFTTPGGAGSADFDTGLGETPTGVLGWVTGTAGGAVTDDIILTCGAAAGGDQCAVMFSLFADAAVGNSGLDGHYPSAWLRSDDLGLHAEVTSFNEDGTVTVEWVAVPGAGVTVGFLAFSGETQIKAGEIDTSLDLQYDCGFDPVAVFFVGIGDSWMSTAGVWGPFLADTQLALAVGEDANGPTTTETGEIHGEGSGSGGAFVISLDVDPTFPRWSTWWASAIANGFELHDPVSIHRQGMGFFLAFGGDIEAQWGHFGEGTSHLGTPFTPNAVITSSFTAGFTTGNGSGVPWMIGGVDGLGAQSVGSIAAREAETGTPAARLFDSTKAASFHDATAVFGEATLALVSDGIDATWTGTGEMLYLALQVPDDMLSMLPMGGT